MTTELITNSFESAYPYIKLEYADSLREVTCRDFRSERAEFEISVLSFLENVFAEQLDLNPVTQDFSGARRNLALPLEVFFSHMPDPLCKLLQNTSIHRYLTRPISEVEFSGDAYTPVFSTIEQRIYNLSETYKSGTIPYRYVAPNRQTTNGDSILPKPSEENIGDYFATRRTCPTAVSIFTDYLEAEACNQSSALPVHVVNRHGKTITECLRYAQQHAQMRPSVSQCYVIQRRHGEAGLGMHFGTLVAILNGKDVKPQRLMYFDTVREPSGRTPWEKGFKDEIDEVFPTSTNSGPISTMAEDGGINLTRPQRDTPMRHRDIDCSFYTFGMARALIRMACTNPNALLTQSIADIQSTMTGQMTDYFVAPNQPKTSVEVREAGIVFRWRLGQESLRRISNRISFDFENRQPNIPNFVNGLFIPPSETNSNNQPAY